jgi:hypothetical protein
MSRDLELQAAEISLAGIQAGEPVVRSSAGLANIFDLLKPAPPPRPDPAAALMDMRLRPELSRRIQSLLSAQGLSVADAEIKDPYGGSMVRRFTSVRGPGRTEIAILQIPSWILGDGNYVAGVEGIRYLFRSKSIRLIAESLDAPWFGLDRRLADWRDHDKIDGRFVPWSYVARALEGAHDLLEVLGIAPGLEQPAITGKKKIRIFFSYSHKDEEYKDKLVKHLSILKRQEVIEEWHDRKIGAGTEWAGAIDQHLESAEIILLLVSDDFLASPYCWDIELTKSMARHADGSARVIPVILRDVDWTGAPFGKLQALPKDGKAIKRWPDIDEAFTDVAKSIRAAVEALRGAP